MGRVDIVIPLYNKAGCIGRAIQSILKQTVSDWRLIVVDDGSTDGGGDVVRGFDDGRIELIRQENAGPGAARNRGIAEARGEFIAFLDADDEWYPSYLATALEGFVKHPGVSMVSTMYCLWPGRQDMTRHWEKLRVSAGKYVLRGEEDAAWVDLLLNFPHVWNSVLPARIVRKYDGFHDSDRCMLGEDTTFFLRVGINEPFLILPEMCVCHHTEDSDLAQAKTPPLPPFFFNPEIVLDYCPEEKVALMRGVLDHMALRFARIRARRGNKAEAKELLERFPGASVYEQEYACCQRAIWLSGWLRHWVRFKCLVGPPGRRVLRAAAERLHMTDRPVAPGEYSEQR